MEDEDFTLTNEGFFTSKLQRLKDYVLHIHKEDGSSANEYKIALVSTLARENKEDLRELIRNLDDVDFGPRSEFWRHQTQRAINRQILGAQSVSRHRADEAKDIGTYYADDYYAEIKGSDVKAKRPKGPKIENNIDTVDSIGKAKDLVKDKDLEKNFVLEPVVKTSKETYEALLNACIDKCDSCQDKNMMPDDACIDCTLKAKKEFYKKRSKKDNSQVTD